MDFSDIVLELMRRSMGKAKLFIFLRYKGNTGFPDLDVSSIVSGKDTLRYYAAGNVELIRGSM